MIKVSVTAKEKLLEYLENEKKADAYVRIYISGTGWGGPRYGLTLAESVEADQDVTEEVEGLKFVFEKGIAGLIDGKVIDYHDGARGGFSFNDENPSDSCSSCSGC